MPSREEKLRAHVEKAVADAPPLSDAQRERIASLLSPRRTLADAPPPSPDAVRRILAALNGPSPARINGPFQAAAGDELLRSLR